ncbi:hypothetical protein PE066_14525 [Ramlibacter tataouinensis]|uniref:hypothetical protein n=1 Tax=Ramlibacter tataouinensis TaxID=94132 RepID=UPI0022F3E78A|nr:hypothetical protein [Ramlibacter tataouinensis]WBY00675.1 hypothetical protein PE066_14525 [Ramlibacter tataouinensis]
MLPVLPPELLFANTALPVSLPASGWVSWAPEVADAPAGPEPELPPEPLFWLGGSLTLLMWGCACLLAAWAL